MNIITNSKPRPILYWQNLTKEEQKEFDYTDKEDGSYFRYRNIVYTLADFLPAQHNKFKGWDGYLSDSFFSAILVSFSDDNDYVIVGTAYS